MLITVLATNQRSLIIELLQCRPVTMHIRECVNIPWSELYISSCVSTVVVIIRSLLCNRYRSRNDWVA